MPSVPTQSGLFIPNGYLNVGSFPGPSGQQDAYGQNFPTGLTPGKIIFLTQSEAQSLAAPGTTLLEGAYQCVQLDSGATVANALAGMAAYIRLDSGATAGALPETDYANGVVTTYDQVATAGAGQIEAGVFIDPATVNGLSTAPIAGQYLFLFVGNGRVFVNITTANNTPALGDVVAFDVTGETVNSSGFQSWNAGSITVAQGQSKLGNAVTLPATAKTAVVAVRGLFGNPNANQGV
jgi:hypothetical protein